MKTIKIPYGKTIHKQLTESLQNIHDIKIYTQLWTENITTYVYDYLLSLYNNNRKKVTLLFFENAIDWQVRFLIPQIISLIRQNKLPKYLPIKIEFDEEDY